MNVKHKLEIVALCPVNGEKDCYKMTVRTKRVIYVEKILKLVDKYKKKKISQEELTHKIARKLGASVTTIGFHSGVKTKVTAI